MQIIEPALYEGKPGSAELRNQSCAVLSGGQRIDDIDAIRAVDVRFSGNDRLVQAREVLRCGEGVRDVDCSVPVHVTHKHGRMSRSRRRASAAAVDSEPEEARSYRGFEPGHGNANVARRYCVTRVGLGLGSARVRSFTRNDAPARAHNNAVCPYPAQNERC
jgi:hypothetical protein